jgi:isovaleryl-CoA dehydrogenase
MGADLFHPAEEHRLLRQMVKDFVDADVEPQAEAGDHAGKLNLELFQKAGTLGLLGITVPESDGGAGLDAVAAVIAHHELSKSDPGFTLAYLAHAMLFVNNFYYASNAEQRARYLP